MLFFVTRASVKAVQQKRIRKARKGDPTFVHTIIDLFIDSKV